MPKKKKAKYIVKKKRKAPVARGGFDYVPVADLAEAVGNDLGDDSSADESYYDTNNGAWMDIDDESITNERDLDSGDESIIEAFNTSVFNHDDEYLELQRPNEQLASDDDDVVAGTARRLARRKAKTNAPSSTQPKVTATDQMDIISYMEQTGISREDMLASIESWKAQIEDLESPTTPDRTKTSANTVTPSDTTRVAQARTTATSKRPFISRFLIKMASKVAAVKYDPFIWFTSKVDGVTLVSEDYASTQKSRARIRIVSAMDFAGTLSHQTQLIHEITTRGEKAAIGQALGLFPDPVLQNEVCTQIAHSAMDLLFSPACLGRTTNDAMEFRKNALFLLAPTAPNEDEPMIVHVQYNKSINDLASLLELTPKTKQHLRAAGFARREFFTGTLFDQRLMQSYKREWNSKKVTPELKKEFEIWLFTVCDVVQASPNKRDTKKVYDPQQGKKVEKRVWHYTFSQREIWNCACKEVAKGGFAGMRDENGKIFISRSSFEKLLPCNLRRMTESQKLMCGCEKCIDRKNMHASLKAFRKSKLKCYKLTLEKLVDGSEEHTLVKESKERFAKAVFPNGEDKPQVWERMEDAMRVMTCKPIGDTPFCPYKCCLGRCGECPNVLPVFSGETSEDGAGTHNKITWQQHAYFYECHLHGPLGRQTKCAKCLALPEKDRSPKDHMSKLARYTLRAPIGVFIRDHYAKFIREEYRQHHWQRNAFGTEWCLKFRSDAMETQVEKESVGLVRDYSDRLSMEYNDSAMSTGLGGGNANLGMEGLLYKIQADGKVVVHWHAFLGDGKQQDCRTSYVNSCKLIRKLQEKGYLQRGGNSVLYIQSDGCGKQYKCATSIKMCSMLAEHFGIAINWMVTCAHHGKCLVDALAGKDKYDLSNGLIKGLDSAMIDENGNPISEADKSRDYLRELRKQDLLDGQLLGDTKHKMKEGATHILTRCYDCTNFTNENDVPLRKTRYEVKSGFYKGNAKNGDHTKNGIMEMFNFYFHPGMPKDMAAVRRVPCLCPACHAQLTKEWISVPALSKKPEKQPRFKAVKDCVFAPMMGDLNEWLFVTVGPAKNAYDEVEMRTVQQNAVEAIESRMQMEIKMFHFGAINTDDPVDGKDGFYLVEWWSEAYTLQAPAMVEGWPDGPMPAGTIVAKGRYYDRVEGAPLWYQRNDNTTTPLFLVKMVLDPDVVVTGCRPGTVEPPANARPYYNNKMAGRWLKKVTLTAKKRLLIDKAGRDKMDLVELELEIVEPGEGQNEGNAEHQDIEGLTD